MIAKTLSPPLTRVSAPGPGWGLRELKTPVRIQAPAAGNGRSQQPPLWLLR